MQIKMNVSGMSCVSCDHIHDTDQADHFRRFLISLVFTLPLLLQMIWMPLGLFGEMPGWIQALLATFVQFYGGWPFYKASYNSALSLSANMDVLIVLGTSAAYFFSVAVLVFRLDQPLYFETSATIITLILLGRWLEARSKSRASEAISKLLNLQPKTARVERGGQFVEAPISGIKPGEIIQVRPGESVPIDGIVVEGESTVNESMLTGEGMPAAKAEGAKVYAATLNQDGVLKVRATNVGSDTALGRIIRLVEHAQNSRAPIQRLADAISEVFVPAVMVISALTLIGWWAYGGVFADAMINAVAVLVIACPCALGLATPTVIVVASGKAASLGILFKEAAALERAEKIKALIFDKTGTLTEGKPVVADIIPAEGTTAQELLEIAFSLEQNSKHPLANAISQYARNAGIAVRAFSNFKSLSGKGILGNIDGKTCYLGSVKYALDLGMALQMEKIEPLERQGKTIAVVWTEDKVLGYLGLADQLKSHSPEAIGRLKQMGIHPIMLTGDHQQTASAIAAQAGIDEYYAEVLPEYKAAKVAELKSKGLIVGMVGDGINDAPALAAADVGFALGSGSDIAIEAADITLVSNDLLSVVNAIQLSKATFKKAKQNLFFAFIYNILGIPLAALGLLNPVIAAAAMALSSLTVVSNALLLRRWTPK